MTFDSRTGRVVILHAVWGSSTSGGATTFGEVDLGNSAGAYYQIKNKKTGQVIGTGGNITDANIGAGNSPDVRLEVAGSAADAATQLWHLTTKSDGTTTLLNKSGGRAAAICTGAATQGQRIGSWVDNTTAGQFTMVTKPDGSVYFRSVQNPSLYLTGATTGAGLTLQPSDNGAGAQDWTLTAQ